MPVPKNNGNVRMGVDFRDFNKACLKDNFPLPHYDRPEKVPLKKKKKKKNLSAFKGTSLFG